MTDPIRIRAINRRAQVFKIKMLFWIALVWGVGLTFAAIAWGGEFGPALLNETPVLKQPSMTFKMERDADEKRGQEFIWFKGIDGVYKELQPDGSEKNVPQTFSVAQRISSIDRIKFDTSDVTDAFETTQVHLLNGEWYVVTDSVDEVWKRLSEAGLYEIKPARAEKETP